MSQTVFDISQAPSNQVNIVDNGGMEIWQRGTSFSSPADQTFTADRWYSRHDDSPTFTVSQEASIIDSGSFALKLNITSVSTATFIQLRQLIENYQVYAGKTLTLSARVNSNVAGVQIRIDDGITSYLSNSHTGNGQYQTLTVTGLMSSSATRILVTLNPQTPAVSTIYFDSVMLTVGPSPATFVPLNPMIDLARCLRFYEAGLVEMSALGRTGPTNYVIEQSMTFATPKRLTPTMTFSSVSVWEEGSNTNVVGSYSLALSPTFGTNTFPSAFSAAASKAIAGAKPSFLSGNWAASADSTI